MGKQKSRKMWPTERQWIQRKRISIISFNKKGGSKKLEARFMVKSLRLNSVLRQGYSGRIWTEWLERLTIGCRRQE